MTGAIWTNRNIRTERLIYENGPGHDKMTSSLMPGSKRRFAAFSGAEEGPLNPHHHVDHHYPSKRPFPTSCIRQNPMFDASLSRSVSGTPPSRSSHRGQFDPDASIVLVGIRGSGKSTLAIMASTAMKRRIVDLEKRFQEITGLSSTAFKKVHGALEHQRRQYGILETVLAIHSKNCVIVSCWMERASHVLLERFATSHPVIHVTREFEAIQEYLKVTDRGKMRELLKYTSTTFRAVANFEFFNVSEKAPSIDNRDESTNEQKEAAPYLTLKRAERHFLKFLSLVMPKGTIPFVESAFPLASVPTESRQFTYAVSLPLSRLLAGDLDTGEIETGADAIEIVVDDLFPGQNRTGHNGHTGHATERTEGGSGSGMGAGTLPAMSAERASRISRTWGHIRRNVVIPIIYHVAWPSSGSLDSRQRSVYLEHVYHGLRLCPEYISVDLRLEDNLLSHILDSRRASKVIGHVHLETSPPPWTDPIWVSYYRKAQSLSCDLVRLTRPATSMEDNFEVQGLHCALRRSEQSSLSPLPVIAYNTGLQGRNSACFNKILTSVVPESMVESLSEPNLSPKSLSAPSSSFSSSSSPSPTPPPSSHSSSICCSSSYITPSITALQASSALRASFATDALKLYVFGANVGYSMSPMMHNAAMRRLGLEHTYQPYSTDSLSNIRDVIHDPQFAGASIGLPFKVEVISLTHSLSSHAKAIGAVNTLIPLRHLDPEGNVPDDVLLFNSRNRAGPVVALYGENTDWIGMRACIRRGLSPANAVRPSTSGLVIGAGGMARAAVYAMLQLGVKNIAVFNRSTANADKMVAHFTQLLAKNALPLLSSSPSDEAEPTRFHVLRDTSEPWPADRFRPPTMIVSCIPTHAIGDAPAPRFTLPPAWMASPTGGVIVDFSYKDLNTPLIIQARAAADRGWVAVDGLDLLPEQGFAQFELFTGRRAPRRLMRGEVLRGYRDEGHAHPNQLKPRLRNITEHEP
ncbi:shikimate dehydrogenase substrate binding domain-containing protein [Xylariomycetidae sp. FL0641]|nr:shikimate dehydrogenase substrate binding domain-containing protein [Xylariomycetidae sp. FL0641]